MTETDTVSYEKLSAKFDEFRGEMQRGFDQVSKQIESVRDSSVNKEMFAMLVERISCNEQEAKEAEGDISAHSTKLADHESRIGHVELVNKLVTAAIVTGIIGAIFSLILKQ